MPLLGVTLMLGRPHGLGPAWRSPAEGCEGRGEHGEGSTAGSVGAGGRPQGRGAPPTPSLASGPLSKPPTLPQRGARPFCHHHLPAASDGHRRPRSAALVCALRTLASPPAIT